MLPKGLYGTILRKITSVVSEKSVPFLSGFADEGNAAEPGVAQQEREEKEEEVPHAIFLQEKG